MKQLAKQLLIKHEDDNIIFNNKKYSIQYKCYKNNKWKIMLESKNNHIIVRFEEKFGEIKNIEIN